MDTRVMDDLAEEVGSAVNPEEGVGGRARTWGRLVRSAVVSLAIILIYPTVVVAIVLAFRTVGFDIAVVRSDSMKPQYMRGDVVILRHTANGNLVEGDVVVFAPVVGGRALPEFMHRLVARDSDGRWQTKGDALADRDPWRVSTDMVSGKAVFSLATRITAEPNFRIAAGSLMGSLLALLFLRRRYGGLPRGGRADGEQAAAEEASP